MYGYSKKITFFVMQVIINISFSLKKKVEDSITILFYT